MMLSEEEFIENFTENTGLIAEKWYQHMPEKVSTNAEGTTDQT